MPLAFPTTYQIVRQGQLQTVTANDLDALIELRTELELVRRFGAGATHELIAVLDRMIAELWTQDRADAPGGPDRIAKLEDMRAILADALSPVNRQTIARIDQECPQAIAGVSMSSIEKDTQEFRQDVIDQLGASGDDDVDALLAAFEQASKETQSSPSVADIDVSKLDPDLQALLADTGSGELDDAALAALADSVVNAADDSATASDGGESEPQEPVDLATPECVEEPCSASSRPVQPDESIDSGFEPQASADRVASQGDGLETTLDAVTAQMTQQLSSAEEQLDAIASAFEAAAAELSQTTGDNRTELDRFPTSTGPETAPADPPTALATNADSAPNPPVADPTPAAGSAAASVLCDPIGAPRQAQTPAATSSVAEIKTQLRQARANILSELDDLLIVLERVDRMQGQAQASLERARQFEQAAARAHRASQALAAAEADAAKARASFDQAQARLNDARQVWEQAQQEASAAAAAVAPA